MYTSSWLPSDSLAEEVPAKSSLPWVWVGFFFVAAFLIEETLEIALELDQQSATIVLVLIALAGWIYWFFCVHRFHKILGEISRKRYPIKGGEAVGKHFIPFYNLVWVFRWPAAMSDYLNQRERVKMVNGNVLGVFLLLSSLVARFFDGAVGLAGIFAVGMYMSAKLRKHVEHIKGISRDLLPPDPDPSLFAPAGPAAASVEPQPRRREPAPLQTESPSGQPPID